MGDKVKVLTFDLDNTIFDSTYLIKKVFKKVGEPYHVSTDYDLSKSYSPTMVKELDKLFHSEEWFEAPILHKSIPTYLNYLHNDSMYKVYYVTQRSYLPIEGSINQLSRNGIECKFEDIIGNAGDKVKILKELGTYMHFDDNPWIVQACLDNGIPIHMISNKITVYNHYLRDKCSWSNNLVTALNKVCCLSNIR